MAWFTNQFFCANVTHFWFSYDSLNSTNQARVTFTRGPKSDISHVLQHDFSLNGRVAFHGMFTSLTCARHHNIASLFRLWLHINLKLAKHVQHSMCLTSRRLLRMWRVTSGPCTGHTWDRWRSRLHHNISYLSSKTCSVNDVKRTVYIQRVKIPTFW